MAQIDLKRVQSVMDTLAQHCLDLQRDFFENGREELKNLGIGGDYQAQVNVAVDKLTDEGKAIANEENTLIEELAAFFQEENYTFESDVLGELRSFVDSHAPGGPGGGGILGHSRTPKLD